MAGEEVRAAYDREGLIATSTNADTFLIKMHIRYWSGSRAEAMASIKPSRGHSYRVAKFGKHGKDDVIVRITDHYDHRDGIAGWR
ncbi:MAG: hypothetical protein V4537_14210 [Pseudomonadota bacterium]